MRILEVIEAIEDKIDRMKEDYIKWIEVDGKTLTARAVSVREKLLANRQLARIANFINNITLIFDSPKTYPDIDSSSAKSKNKLTFLKCK